VRKRVVERFPRLREEITIDLKSAFQRQWRKFSKVIAMDAWSSGYVTDVVYTYGVYRELTPSLLAFVALIAGVAAPDPDTSLNYCELGCGQGYSANLFAAANPHIQIYANDFNPSHIYGARRLAEAAGTRNVHFFDDGFADFGSRAELPQFDVIGIHGIYSWISPENRRHIVEFIRSKLKPGGLVYISYNALPAWDLKMPMRRLMADYAAKLSGPTNARVDEALSYVQRLVDVDARYFLAVAGLTDVTKALKDQDRNYLAHEYFNRNLTPFYHADVVDELSDAKLTYVGSAALLENLDAVNFTAEQQALLESVSDRTEREMLRDFIRNQQFRRDVFIKGAVPLQPDEARERWLRTRFALSTSREHVPLTVNCTLGEATLQADVYDPVLDGLANGPRTVEQLLSDPKIAEVGWDRVLQALAVLVGAGHLETALSQAGEAERVAPVKAFNTAILNAARSSDNLRWLASPVTGGSAMLDRFTRLFLLAVRDGHDDPPSYAWELLKSTGVKLQKNDTTLETDDENLAEMREIFGTYKSRLAAVFQTLGIA
jgi:SAM-dependent methyltransferase